MLAQAVTGTPGHINTMARSVGHFLEVFPVAQMKEGDVYVTNDPWKGTGHLYDLVVVSPTFMDGRIVALFACTTHLVDMGGVGQTPEGRQIYHEGLFIPLLRLARAGEMNEDLLAMIRANVREPVQVIGDVYALIACNEIGSRRLVAMMREFALRDLDHAGRGDHQPQPPGHGGGDRQAAAGHLDRVDAHRRLRGADRSGRHADHRPRHDPCGLYRHVGHVVLRDQLSAVLYRGLYDVRRELRGGAAHPEQHRHAGCGARHRTGGHDPQRDASRGGVCAFGDGTHAAGRGVWLSRPGAAGTRAGGRHIQSVDAEPDRGARADRHRPRGRHAVHGEQLPFGWRGCAAERRMDCRRRRFRPACATCRWRRPRRSRRW